MDFLRVFVGGIGSAATVARASLRRPLRSLHDGDTQPKPIRSVVMSFRFAAIAAAIGFLAAVAVPAGAQNAKPVELADGLKYTDTKAGDGPAAEKGLIVSVNYTGWLYKNGAKGAEFDSSKKAGKPITFRLGAGQVVKGWDEGISG